MQSNVFKHKQQLKQGLIVAPCDKCGTIPKRQFEDARGWKCLTFRYYCSKCARLGTWHRDEFVSAVLWNKMVLPGIMK